jgi:phosphoenolpyruvate carboxykinase (ATP)
MTTRRPKTRAAPIRSEFINNSGAVGPRRSSHERRDADGDAFGVLPPIARLSPEAAMYHFLSGYTAKVAGTERGVTEPKATFSTCFGAPFMVWDPNVYAKLLGERIAKHKSHVWLVNTGWTGGPYGVGTRMKIAHTRAMINAALSGALATVPVERDPIFNLDVPTACPGVPAEVLNPRNTWEGQGGLRPDGEEARDDVRRQLQDVRSDVVPGRQSGGTEGVIVSSHGGTEERASFFRDSV